MSSEASQQGAAPAPAEAAAPAVPTAVGAATTPDAGGVHRGRHGRRWWRWPLPLLQGLVVVGLAWLVGVLSAMVVYTRVDPPFTTLTAWAWLAGREVRQDWVPLRRISPALARAVLASEDSGFCRHAGVSLAEIEEAIERSLDGVPRGASTISMQVTKNLFLWPQRSYLRKAIEIPLALVLEQILGKQRILEIYLNVAEWGPGIYGIEAAARHHFRKPAARLTEAEAALLAVTLPSPATRNPARPGPQQLRLAAIIEARARADARLDACLELRGGSTGRGRP